MDAKVKMERQPREGSNYRKKISPTIPKKLSTKKWWRRLALTHLARQTHWRLKSTDSSRCKLNSGSLKKICDRVISALNTSRQTVKKQALTQ